MKHPVFVCAVVLILSPALAAAQGHGGGQGQGRGQGQGQGQSQAGRAGQGAGAQAGQGSMNQDQIRQRDRLHTMATDRQRAEYRTCDQAMDRIRTHAKNLSKTSNGKSFNSQDALQQRDQLRDQIRVMQQDHQQMMQSLNDEQRNAVQQRTKSMAQLQERTNNRLQNMDRELSQTNPDPKRVSTEAREIERNMNEWQKQHRQLGSTLGLDVT